MQSYKERVEHFLVQEAILECEDRGFDWTEVQQHRETWLRESAHKLGLYLATREMH